MSTFIKREFICGVCGSKSIFNVLASTNSFGSADLDSRPPEMQRSTMRFWVQKCPHCNYVSSTIDTKTSLSNEYFSSPEYLNSEYLSFPSDLGDTFYKRYMITKQCGRYDEAYSALLHCAWVCDDFQDKKTAYLIRSKMVDTFDNLSQKMKRNENIIAQFADVLRRCGQFDAVIEKFSDFKTNNEVIDKVIKFQIELSKNKDDNAYTVSDALNS